MRGRISCVSAILLASCWASLGHADNTQYGDLDFSRLSIGQADFFWKRLSILASEEALITYCGQPDNFVKTARQGIQACVAAEALHKAESYFQIKMNADIAQFGSDKLACKSQPLSVGGWLGIQMQAAVVKGRGDASGDAVSAGPVVVGTFADSPAAAADIQVGDVITSVNGENVANPNELRAKIAPLGPQATARLGILRKGEVRTVNVKLGTMTFDSKGKAAFDISASIKSSKADLNLVSHEVTDMCQRCKISIWAVFCR